jgi:hypothetical protein
VAQCSNANGVCGLSDVCRGESASFENWEVAPRDEAVTENTLTDMLTSVHATTTTTVEIYRLKQRRQGQGQGKESRGGGEEEEEEEEVAGEEEEKKEISWA